MSIRYITSRVSIAAALVIAASVVMSRVAVGQGTAAPATPSTGSAATGLRYEKMLYLAGDSVKTVPAGYLWQVQSVLSTETSLTEGGFGSFMAGMKNESEASQIARGTAREHALWLDGKSYYVSGFPLNLEAGTKVSAGTKGGVLVVMQLKVE